MTNLRLIFRKTSLLDEEILNLQKKKKKKKKKDKINKKNPTSNVA